MALSTNELASGTALDSILLAAVTRTRHYVGAFEELLGARVENDAG